MVDQKEEEQTMVGQVQIEVQEVGLGLQLLRELRGRKTKKQKKPHAKPVQPFKE